MKRVQAEFSVRSGKGDRSSTWVRDGALKGRPLLVLAHGAGAPYSSDFMARTATELVDRGLCVARFHFPYMHRAVTEDKRRPPDGSPTLLETWRVMLAEVVHAWRGHGPVFVGGKSMGGRLASMLLASEHPASVVGAVYLGYPLHPPGRTDKLRAEHLVDVGVPQLFVSGDKDRLAEPGLLAAALDTILRPPPRLHVVPGGDHSLAAKRSDPWAGAEAWLDAVAAFVHEVAAG